MCLETLKELMIGVQDWDQIKQHRDCESPSDGKGLACQGGWCSLKQLAYQVVTYVAHPLSLVGQLTTSQCKQICGNDFAKISQSEPVGGSSPKLPSGATEHLSCANLQPTSLLCAAQGAPVPAFR